MELCAIYKVQSKSGLLAFGNMMFGLASDYSLIGYPICILRRDLRIGFIGPIYIC